MASTFTEEEEEAEMTDAELREALILYYEKVTKPGFTFSMEVLGDPDGTMTAMVHGLVKEFAGEVEAEEICLHDPYGEPEKDEAGEDKREEPSLADQEEIYEAEEEEEEEEEEAKEEAEDVQIISSPSEHINLDRQYASVLDEKTDSSERQRRRTKMTRKRRGVVVEVGREDGTWKRVRKRKRK